MISFDEIVKNVDNLSSEELDELGQILRRKKEREILLASEQATKEYKEGKTISLKNEEEIKNYFNNLKNEDH